MARRHSIFPRPMGRGPHAGGVYTIRRGGGSGGGGGSGDNFAGVGSPEGAVTANPGGTYVQTDTGRLWKKVTGTGNTGWEYETMNRTGTGSPEGAVVGRPGDTWIDTATDIKYAKKSGVETNTGWI